MQLSYPMRGWAEIRWTEDEDLPSPVVDLLMSLSDLPGVKLEADYVQVPRNAWETADWSMLRYHIDMQGAGEQPDGSYVWRIRLPDGRMLQPPSMSPDVRTTHPPAQPYYPPWQPAQPLYDHQEEAAFFLVNNRGGLCADEMGLGKTRTAIVAAETLAQEAPARHRLIIGPKHTRAVWLRELLAVGAITHPEQFWAAETRDPTKGRPDWDATWFFVHYDIVWWWASYLARGPNGPPIVSILDELHWVKNGRVKRSKGAQALAGTAPNRIGLTGTPLPNRPGELWWPLTIIDGKHSWGSPIDFRVRYCGATHNGMGYEDMGPTRVEELQRRLSNRYIRRTVKDSGVNLPKMTRQLLRCRLSDTEQEKTEAITRDVGKDNIVRAVLERRAGKDTLAAITKLRKITSQAKLETTTAFVTDALEAGESVVVFTWMRATARRIAESFKGLEWGPCGRQGRYLIHGGFTQEERDASVREYQDEGGVLVATLDSLKEGVTLTKARFIVLHDLSWVPSDILQAEARVHRIGQDKPVLASWVVADDSIDMLLAATVTGKANAMAEALGITAAQEAAEELGLEDFAVTSSVEAEMERLLGAWDR